MEDPVSSKSSIVGSSRVAILRAVVVQQGWRVPELLHRLLDVLRPHLSHPYDEVRSELGDLLGKMHWNDIEYPGAGERSNKRNPRVADLISEIIPQLEILRQEITTEEPGAQYNSILKILTKILTKSNLKRRNVKTPFS